MWKLAAGKAYFLLHTSPKLVWLDRQDEEFGVYAPLAVALFGSLYGNNAGGGAMCYMLLRLVRHCLVIDYQAAVVL